MLTEMKAGLSQGGIPLRKARSSIIYCVMSKRQSYLVDFLLIDPHTTAALAIAMIIR
jgi:hypothetical protein